MMRKFFILLYLNLFMLLFSQNSKIEGKWILDKETELNGNLLPINDADFSHSAVYIFAGDKMKISGIDVPITITSNKINTPGFGFEYELKDDYLILKNTASKRVLWLLKPETFIELYPEFRPKEIIIEDKVCFVQNEVIQADFNYKNGFMGFWMDFFSTNEFDKEQIKFVVQFVVTKESKVEKINFLDINNSKIELRFKDYIKTAEKFFNNKTGKDVFYQVSQIINFRNDNDNYRGQHDDYINNKRPPEFLKYIKNKKKADDAYLKNDFKNAINLYEKMDVSKTYSFHTSDMYLKLGVSYLATENINAGCVNFEKAGGLTNFKTRNYIINFCNKK